MAKTVEDLRDEIEELRTLPNMAMLYIKTGKPTEGDPGVAGPRCQDVRALQRGGLGMRPTFPDFNPLIVVRFPWWLRLRLWFVKPVVGVDFASGHTITMKCWRGRWYVVRDDARFAQ